MTSRPTTRVEQDARATRLTLYGAAALLGLTLLAVTILVLRPYSNSASVKEPGPEQTTTKPSTAPTKKAAPAPAKTNPPSKTLPEQMRTLGSSSRQIIIATGASLGSKTGTLRIFNLEGRHWKQVFTAPARFGTNGLVDGLKRVSGSRTTPTGLWSIGSFVFGQHAQAPDGTLMLYRAITPNSYWSEAPDNTYNTWVESETKVDGEHLADAKVQYELALSTGYNQKPNTSVVGRGTAIFLHVFDPPDYNNGFSAGCVAVSRTDMMRVFRIVDPARDPYFAIGTEQKGTPNSIWAY